MSKLNPSIKKSTKTVFDTERLAGGSGMLAAKQSNYDLLRRAVLANLLWEDIAYMDGVSVADEIKRLIPLCDAKNVAQLAYEARNIQKLRHTPLFLISEMCKYEEHRKSVGELLPMVITRADMLTDFLALYWKDGKTPLCNQVKKGLAKSFSNFDEYQFAKYDRDAAIKLRDVMFLSHPKAKDEKQEELFKKIASRTLATPDTWEVALSRGDNKMQTWIRLIKEHKIGGMAMLRNISNMEKAQVPTEIIQEGISNVRSNMLLPLDFYKAYKMNPKYKDDIEAAMIQSYAKLPKLKGKTLFIVDVSGSMDATLSSKSMSTRKDAAITMAMLATNQCEDCRLVVTAGNDGRGIHATAEIENPKKGFGLFDQVNKTKVGYGGIFTRQCLEWCREHFKDEDFDRIIVFSDSQDCDRMNRTPKPFGKYNYICDVSNHIKGINYKGIWTSEISGFSENFLSFISVSEGNINLFE